MHGDRDGQGKTYTERDARDWQRAIKEKDDEIRRLAEIVQGQSLGAVVVVAAGELDEKDAQIKARGGRIAALEAEVASLTPSGQVAEDERCVDRWLAGIARGDSGPHAALSRLAAQAQGYEAMKAERDAALADNAALLEKFRLIWQACIDLGEARGIARTACEEPHPGTTLLAEHAKALEVVALIRQYQHRNEPDVLTTLRRLLEERLRITRMISEQDHAKALVRARNEGLEEVWSMATVAVGDDLKAYLQGPAPHDQIINTALRAIQRCLVQLRHEEPET